jgi:uncharacterized protein (UPF0264 family)
VTALLVSVRCAQEAEAALRGGASLIDVKEPARGSLGRASDRTIEEIVRVVAGRRPVSAALGEFVDTLTDDPPSSIASLTYLKWGLSRSEDGAEDIWQDRLATIIRRVADRHLHVRVVAVAYADWQRARAPLPERVCTFALSHPVGGFLLDTWHKDGSTLLDWQSRGEIARLRRRCAVAGMPIALAGSLGLAEIDQLLPLQPDWFAVRGAACPDRQREAAIDENLVRRLVALLDGHRS